MTNSNRPSLALLDVDGWTLQDAEQRLTQRDGLYWIPDRWVREHLDEHVPEGGYVKLLFRILDEDDPSSPAIERMWVTLAHQDGDWYHGHLANTPRTRGRVVEGTPIWYRAEHVIDYAGPDGENQASESADAVRCRMHGLSERCYVCEHLTPDAEPCGFNTASDDVLRPDAWCDACQVIVDQAGSWDALGDQHPKIKLVCGGCYDMLKARHERNGC